MISVLGDNKRTALVRKNIIFSFLIKGWSCLVMFLMVRLTLDYLGEYQNGVWLTISSMLVLIDNMDIGLGNGLRNTLATELAHGNIEKAREAVSTTFFMLIIVIVPVALILIGITQGIDVYRFNNVNPFLVPNLETIIVVAIIFICSTFVFKFIGNFYLGLQLPAANNLLVTCGQTLALAATFIFYLTTERSLLIVAIVNTASPLAVYLLAYPYTFYHKYKNLRPSYRFFNKDRLKGLFSIGVKFFILQIAGAVIFQTSNIIISKLFTPSAVTPYQISYRYFSLVLLAFSIICTPYWTATTDAYERHDFEWIKKSERRMRIIFLLMLVLISIMTAVSGIVYHVWIGNSTTIPLYLTIGMGVYFFVLILSLGYSYFLNGMGLLRIQLITTTISAIIYIPCTYLGYYVSHNILSIIVVLILVNLPGLCMNIVQFRKVVNGTASGIFLKK